jgi:hypothetical protein
MLRKTPENPQIDLFSNARNFINGKALRLYEDKNAWHNVFRREVTSKIDEGVFSPLFSEGTGRPNASIRVLVAMMILKEAEGMSDEKLFEHCRFNMLYLSALGLINLSDSIPTESTYYLFRKSIAEYDKKHQTNLYEQMFAKLTQEQAVKFEVSGKSVRMDSKLIGSNIVWLSRYELIHKTLSLYFNEIKHDVNLSEKVRNRLNELLKTESSQVVYRNSSAEVKSLILELGTLIIEVLTLKNYSKLASYQTLQRIFTEQYKIVNKQIELKEKEDISADSVQSPYDTDCSYRHKGDKNDRNSQQVKGYSVNVTETCDEGRLNLITDIAVAPASASDTDFLQDALENTQKVVANKIENAHTDGAYNSPDNQAFCEANNIEFYLHAIQGAKSRYDLELNSDNSLKITDLKNGLTVENELVTSRTGEMKWRVKAEKGYRYFTSKEVETCQLRKKIASTPREILEKRNNVEATIFQLSYHCRKVKTRYRGLIKHKMWAIARCLWINFVRILNSIVNSGPTIVNNATEALKHSTITPFFVLSMTKGRFLNAVLVLIAVLFRNYQPGIGKT